MLWAACCTANYPNTKGVTMTKQDILILIQEQNNRITASNKQPQAVAAAFIRATKEN